MKEPAFKWVKVTFYTKKDFPTRKFVTEHFKETLAVLTVMYANGIIRPSTSEVKFKLEKEGFEDVPEMNFPTPITEVNLKIAIHREFPNAKWVEQHYTVVVRRLASLYMIGSINPTVSVVKFGVPSTTGRKEKVNQLYADQLYNYLMEHIKIEWKKINTRNREFIDKYMGKHIPQEIDIKKLAEEMERKKKTELTMGGIIHPTIAEKLSEITEDEEDAN